MKRTFIICSLLGFLSTTGCNTGCFTEEGTWQFKYTPKSTTCENLAMEPEILEMDLQNSVCGTYTQEYSHNLNPWCVQTDYFVVSYREYNLNGKYTRVISCSDTGKQCTSTYLVEGKVL